MMSLSIKSLLIGLLGILALLLAACTPMQGTGPHHGQVPHPDHQNQPHLPPPGFPGAPPPVGQGRTCSGFTNAPLAQCSPQEFCYIPTGQYCGAADYPGVCRTRPQVCTQEYRPVCGCDGQTYSNECVAHSRGVSVANEGPCQ